MNKRIILIGIFTALCTPLFAQYTFSTSSLWDTFSINNFGVEDGIFTQQVYKIHKDKKGFYWIVSNRQLLRYDGISITELKQGNIGGTLYDLAEDSDGNMWIPSIGSGLYKFNGDTLKNYQHLSGDLTKAAVVGKNDTLYLGTYGDGLKVFYKDSLNINYNTKNGLVGDEIWTLEFDKNGKLWIGTNTGISVLHKGTIKNFTTENGLPDNRIRTIKALANGDVWVGTDKEGIVIFEEEKPIRYIHTKDGLPNLLVQDIEQNLNGDVFIGTLGGGVTRFNNGIKETINIEDGLISNEVNTIYLDNNGMILIGTEDGLSTLTPRFFTSLSLDGKEVYNQEAVTINQDKAGRIWLGTYGKGYFYFENGKWTSRENPPINTNGYAQSGTLDKNGNLWVGTQGSGVLEIVDNQFIPRFNIDNGLLDNYVRGLTFDLEGNLWVGSNKGISVFNSSQELIRTYSTEDEIPNPFCITMITASDGSVWYGSYGGGAVRFKDGISKVYNTETGLRSDQVLSIFEDSNQDIWIGTFNYGVSKVVGDSLFTFSPDDGLPSANYAGIIEDNSKNLWFATGNGITKAALKDLNSYQNGESSYIPFHYFNKEDGLISDNLQAANNSTLAKLSDGTLFFASIDGVSIIHPESVAFKDSSFNTYIDNIIVDGVGIIKERGFELTPDKKKLEISYSAINFLAPNKTEFRIKLDGIDNEWNYVEKRTTAYYDYLPDGDYTFYVSAVGPDGQWSDKVASIPFTVLPPFYKTWWFISLGLLGFIAIGAGGVQIRSNMKLRELNRELQTQQKIQRERERISRELHDNVGSQITNLITGIEISNLHIKKNQQDKALSLLGNLDSDARSAMTDLRETIWLLDKEEVQFGIFLEHLKGFVKRQEHYFRGMKVVFNSDVDLGKILNPTQSLNLTRIIQEALNNARKYAQASLFTISFVEKEQRIGITLTDNGIGMNIDERPKEGNGLRNMKERIEEVNGTIVIKTETGKGTSIRLEL
ncbi:MAG: two-component regulator propeller domain-containing protein [Balneolaceae bacterium]